GCGCLGLLLVSGGLFIFLIAPGLISYVVTLDAVPLYELQVGETVTHADFAVQLLRIDRSSPCLEAINCTASEETIRLVFSTTLDDDAHVVTFADEMTFIALPNGYLLRVLAVTASPVTTMNDARVQLQLFEPPPLK
ncbi:MAG: hypothetical protein AAFN11_13545, partial [Chloroflexota bacterium]